jgi:hypothetical protein
MPRCGAKAHENDSSSSSLSSYSAFFEDEHDDEEDFHRKISKNGIDYEVNS